MSDRIFHSNLVSIPLRKFRKDMYLNLKNTVFRVSIPLRKFRKDPDGRLRPVGAVVSIPLRKFRKCIVLYPFHLGAEGFHPSKEV